MDPDPEPLFILLTVDSTTLVSSIVLILLFVCSALISGAEVAFFSLTPTDLEDSENTDQTNPKLKTVASLLETPKKLLATILVANNTINIAIVLLFASIGDAFFGNVKTTLWGVSVRFIIEIIIITFLILLFGEILPKIYASRNNIKFASFMAYPLRVLDIIFTPLSAPMRYITLQIHNKLGDQKSNFNVDQLSQALELTSEGDTTK